MYVGMYVGNWEIVSGGVVLLKKYVGIRKPCLPHLALVLYNYDGRPMENRAVVGVNLKMYPTLHNTHIFWDSLTHRVV